MNPQDLTVQLLIKRFELNPYLQNIHWEKYSIKSCDMNNQYQDFFGLRTTYKTFKIEIEETNYCNFLCISLFGDWFSYASLDVTVERLGDIINNINKLSALQIIIGIIIGYENIIKFEKRSIAIQDINNFNDYHRIKRMNS